ncbi:MULTISPECIES: gas vesicle protein GvpM [Haloprofundus]|uniref:gas vesicle protein GvpM n=1 Tax=Haloprofundus TaxID=1911573 RepID=UPI000E430D89|nr:MULTISPECIES: gas vesicle protein [Haloprofundus]QCJ47362.1 gas vesicle protein [Haloprofundus sp. MHR1]
MRPTRRDDDAVVDLLDVLLTEGVMIQADLIVTVADIPLLGVQLRAALAGMETMLEYGLLSEWDEKTRERARRREEQLRGSRGARPYSGVRPTPETPTGDDGTG